MVDWSEMPDEDYLSVGYSDESDDDPEKQTPGFGQWKTDLAAVTQESIPEDKLHIVPWGRLALHTARNMSVIVLFVAFAVVAHLPIYVSLPLFLATFLLGVICFEVLQTWILGLLCLAFVMIFVAGTIAMGPLHFMSYFARFLIVPFLLIIIVLRLVEKPGTQRLYGTRLWQALSGWKYGVIKNKLDLAKLCKSMCHHKGETVKHFFWDKLNKFSGCCGVRLWSTVRIQMVQVEESSPEIGDVTLELNGQEFEPDKYLLIGLTRYKGPVENCHGSGWSSRQAYAPLSSGIPSCLNMQDLESVLRKRKVSDRLVDSWLNPEAWRLREEKAAASAYSNVEKEDPPYLKVKKWMCEAEFLYKGDSMIVACFRRYNYLEGLWEHWAPCALSCLVGCTFLSFPAVHMLMILAQERQTLCKGSREVANDREVVCGTGVDVIPCKEACRSFLDFAAAFNDTFSTSNVELFLVFIMIPVCIFEFSVGMVQREHNVEELAYFQRLRKPKKAIAEVARLKAKLEDVLTLSFQLSSLWRRLWTCILSWRGADPALAACGPITEAEFGAEFDLTPSYNNCLRMVLEPVTKIIKSRTAYAKSDLLPHGIGFDGKANEDEIKTAKEEIKKAWDRLKDNGLGDTKNYKVLFDLQMYTEDSWKVFTVWFKYYYGLQYKNIVHSVEAQDAGKHAHIGAQNVGRDASTGARGESKRTRSEVKSERRGKRQIYDVLMPNGFCLTHIFTQAMPEDGKPYQIELQRIRKEEEFWQQCTDMVHSIKTAPVDENEEDDDTNDTVLDRRLEGNPIVARFTLSEQYFNKMEDESVKVCLDGNQSRPTDFTEFCDRLLEPQERPKLPKLLGENVIFWTRISVLMVDANPMQAVLTALWALCSALRVVFECFAIALVVPMLRLAMDKPMFPQPLRIWLIMNTACIWCCLTYFFSDFHKARTRLSLISNCLAKLEQKTQSPVPRASANLKEEKRDGFTDAEMAKARVAQDRKKAEEDASPFDLVIADSTMAGQEYHPSRQAWKDEWKEKHTNVTNWHDTVSHLRVFVSTSRLVAQTMLVAAALIVGLLLLMSLLQTMNAGNGSTAVHAMEKEATARRLGATVQAGQFAARRLHEEVGDAMQALSALAERKAVSHAAMPAAAPTEEPLSHLAGRLRTALVPAHAALHGILLHQHDSLVKGHAWLQKRVQVNSAFGQTRRLAAEEDEEELTPEEGVESSEEKVKELARKLHLSKSTKTQIFTMVVVIFVILHSVPLMWNIVLVNGFFDRHEDLLVKQKEKHMLHHARRVLKNGKSGSDDRREDAKADSRDEGMIESRDEKSMTEEAEETAGMQTEGTGDSVPKDPYCKCFEKTLDMAIEAARKSRERFPLKLFGFVITAQLVATWVCLAATSVLPEAKELLPGLALYSCSMLERSMVLEAVQEQMDVNNPSMHITLKQSLHENVCEPMREALIMSWDSLPEELTEEQQEKLTKKITDRAGPKTRRLLSGRVWAEAAQKKPLYEIPMPDLRDIVTAWWAAHPSHQAQVRYATGYAALQELSRAGDRLLVAEPMVLANAFSARHNIYQGFAVALGVAKGHLEAALVEEENFETLHVHERFV